MPIDETFKYAIVVASIVAFVFGAVYLILQGKIIIRSAEASSFAAAVLRSIYMDSRFSENGILLADKITPKDLSLMNCRFEVFIRGVADNYGAGDSKKIMTIRVGYLPIYRRKLEWEKIELDVYEVPYFCKLYEAWELGEAELLRCNKECHLEITKVGDKACISIGKEKWCKYIDIPVKPFSGDGKVFTAKRVGNEVVVE